jgi:mono/diheme cytochrome c family protein
VSVRWRSISMAILALAMMAALRGSAQGQQEGKANPAPAASSAGKVAAPSLSSAEDLRAEGETRFRANCGRCHQSPHRFPPRMVMTIERHMRVRATLTEEDMRAIVAYLTQ